MYDLELCTLHIFSVTEVLKDTSAISASASSTVKREQICWVRQLVLRAPHTLSLWDTKAGDNSL